MTGFYHTILQFPELDPDIIYLTEQVRGSALARSLRARRGGLHQHPRAGAAAQPRGGEQLRRQRGRWRGLRDQSAGTVSVK